VVAFDQHTSGDKKFLKETEAIEETDGSLKQSNEKDKLMKSVLESGDENNIDLGKVITESASRGLGNFTPDLFFEHLVKNFDNADRMYGESLIREITGYSPEFIRKNVKIPEFKRELEKRVQQAGKELQKNKVINKEGDFSEETIELAAVLMLTEELDKLESSDLGPRINEKGNYGLKGDVRNFRNDRYKNIAVKQTIKTALRRGHKEIDISDFRSYDLDKHRTMNIIYALDTSGSMMGDKLNLAKRAGIALAWKSIKEKNKVGLIVFNAEINDEIVPGKEVMPILKSLSGTKASAETDMSKAIEKSIELFKNKKGKKHLLLVTDGMPTKGELPISKTYESASKAVAEKISISILGIGLEEKGEEVAKKIAEIGEGKLYMASDHEDIDGIVLEDYYESLRHA
jgi:Mg-chelatase subunit ChlD